MSKITIILASILSTFGFLYLAELRTTNPALGVPVIAGICLLYIGAVVHSYGKQKR